MSDELAYALLANAWALAWVLTGNWLCVLFAGLAFIRELCAVALARINKE